MGSRVEYCRSCMSEKLVGAVHLDNFYIASNNERINFLQMFRETTNINPDEDNFSKKLCYTCTESLQISYEFRKRCWNSQNTLLNQKSGSGGACPPVVKVERMEIEPQIDLFGGRLLPDNSFDEYLKKENVDLPDDNDFFDENFDSIFVTNLERELTVKKEEKKRVHRATKPKPSTSSKQSADPEKGDRQPSHVPCYAFGCKQVFPYQGDWLKHIAKMQAKGDTSHKFQCDICERTFTDGSYFSRHMTNRHREIACKMCDKIFVGRDKLQSHYEKVHKDIEVLAPCGICRQVFKNTQELLHHKKQAHKGADLKHSELTKDLFSLLSMDTRHIKDGHFCPAFGCNEVFENKRGLLKHLECFEGLPNHMYSCDICKKEFLTKYKLTLHIKSMHVRILCNNCPSTFENLTQLKKHIKENHEANKIFSGTCKVCGKGFATLAQLKKHKQVHNDKDKIYKFFCDICGKASTKKTIHDQHMINIHVDARPYVCDICGKSYKQKFLLQRHIELNHLDRPLLHCDICGATTKSREYLKQHKLTHTRKFEVACEVCGLVFNRRVNLTQHMMVHTQGPAVDCPVCHKSYKSDKHLKEHMKHHQEKKYHCTMCEQSFIRPSLLKNHMNAKHENKRRFQCTFPNCGKAYKWHSHLITHMKIIHLGTAEYSYKKFSREQKARMMAGEDPNINFFA